MFSTKTTTVYQIRARGNQRIINSNSVDQRVKTSQASTQEQQNGGSFAWNRGVSNFKPGQNVQSKQLQLTTNKGCSPIEILQKELQEYFKNPQLNRDKIKDFIPSIDKQFRLNPDLDYLYLKVIYYDFKTDYKTALKQLDSLLQRPNLHNNKKFSILNLHLQKFKLYYCSILQVQKIDLITLKQKYQDILIKIDKSSPAAKEKIFFIKSLIYHQILVKVEQIQKYYADVNSRKELKGLECFRGIGQQVQNYNLQYYLGTEQSKPTSKLHPCAKNISKKQIRLQAFNDILNFLSTSKTEKNSKKIQIPFDSKKIVQIRQREEKKYYIEEKNRQFYSYIRKQRYYNNSTIFDNSQKYQIKREFLNLKQFFIDKSNTNNWLCMFSKQINKNLSEINWKQVCQDRLGITITQNKFKQIPEQSVLEQQAIQQQEIVPEEKNRKQLTTTEKIKAKVMLQTTDNNTHIQNSKLKIVNQSQVNINKGLEQNYNRGLKNIGNTCYVNSALQCLHKSKHFEAKFNSALKAKINKNPSKYKLSSLMCDFMEQMWKNKSAYIPKQIKQLVAQKNILFQRNAQNDSVEFFTYLISELSQELNQPKTTSKPVEIKPFEDPPETIYKKTIQRDEAFCKSIIQETFTGRYKVSYQCQKCRGIEILFEKFNYLYLSIPSTNRLQIGLKQCIYQNNKRVEYLRGENKMTCGKCGIQAQSKKSMEVYAANHILTIAINRFKDNYKNTKRITIPLTLEPQEILLNHSDYKNKVYKLYAAIIHVGNLHAGHYTAICYNYKTNQWVLFNDQSKAQIQQSNLDYYLREVYAVFYELSEVGSASKQDMSSRTTSQVSLNDQPVYQQPRTKLQVHTRQINLPQRTKFYKQKTQENIKQQKSISKVTSAEISKIQMDSVDCLIRCLLHSIPQKLLSVGTSSSTIREIIGYLSKLNKSQNQYYEYYKYLKIFAHKIREVSKNGQIIEYLRTILILFNRQQKDKIQITYNKKYTCLKIKSFNTQLIVSKQILELEKNGSNSFVNKLQKYFQNQQYLTVSKSNPSCQANHNQSCRRQYPISFIYVSNILVIFLKIQGRIQQKQQIPMCLARDFTSLKLSSQGFYFLKAFIQYQDDSYEKRYSLIKYCSQRRSFITLSKELTSRQNQIPVFKYRRYILFYQVWKK